MRNNYKENEVKQARPLFRSIIENCYDFAIKVVYRKRSLRRIYEHI